MNEHDAFQIAYSQGFVSTLTEPKQRDPEGMEHHILFDSDVAMDHFATWLAILHNLEFQGDLTKPESDVLLHAWLRGFLQGISAAIEGLFGRDEERVGAVAEIRERITTARRNDKKTRAELWQAGAGYVLGRDPSDANDRM